MIKQKTLRLTAEVVRRTKKLASVVMPYEPMTQGKSHLDKQYAAAEWDYLRTIGETPRFGVVAAYCRDLAPSGTVLEIGCGDGILLNHLDRGRLSAYCGLDISSVAIDRARALEDDRTTFVCAPAESYVPDRAFDVIVFNEVLEYFDDPAGVVKRYEPFVAPGGHLVVSMFAGTITARTRGVWRLLGRRYETMAYTKVSTHREYLWNIKVFPVPEP